MPKTKRPRRGSLQFYPRKRAGKQIPSANWKTIKGEGILGFLAYKVGMASAVVKDNTEDSMTKGKRLTIPVTVLEAPSMKIFSVRFYKNGVVMKDIVVSIDKELKKKVKLPKEAGKLEKIPEGYDNIRVIAYSIPKQTSIKKTPDLIELAIGGENKLEFVKSLIGKELSISDFLKDALVDVHGLTKGKGFVGPVKRFGIALRQHKSEKGVRKAGSIGPWHPAHVTFRTPMAGQLGMFSRVVYNLKVINSGKISEKDINQGTGFKNYGKIKTSYIILKGSVQGPEKRAVLLTPSFRPTKSTEKKNYEFVELTK
jgi:large subunit ribosomal protein L3